MANAIIIVLLIIIAVFSIKSYAKKLSKGCCGAGGDSTKKIKVKDKNIANYPFCTVIGVEGMTCVHCKLRVENALNGWDGVWAATRADFRYMLLRAGHAKYARSTPRSGPSPWPTPTFGSTSEKRLPTLRWPSMPSNTSRTSATGTT